MAVTFDGHGCPKCAAELDGLGPGDFCPGCRVRLDTHEVFSQGIKPGRGAKWMLRLGALACVLLAAGVFVMPLFVPDAFPRVRGVVNLAALLLAAGVAMLIAAEFTGS